MSEQIQTPEVIVAKPKRVYKKKVNQECSTSEPINEPINELVNENIIAPKPKAKKAKKPKIIEEEEDNEPSPLDGPIDYKKLYLELKAKMEK